jgi:mannitol-1-phosphate/altronate dehydrogenase
VGPKQCYEIINKFKKAKNIITCENDRNSKKIIKEITNIKNVYFAIPDVITSNTAPAYLKKIDDLCTVSEQGVLVVENSKLNFSNVAQKLNQDELDMHWNSKLFIHNAPHAILSYLGAKKKYQFIHEAMNDKIIRKIVISSMKEISEGLIKSGLVNKKFVKYYRNKEIKRFENKILYDPISRVAREPLRKLASDNRIILSLRLAFLGKKLPINTLIGLKAALSYYDKNDDESVFLYNLNKSSNESEVLKKISGIEEKDPISLLCKNINLNRYLKI